MRNGILSVYSWHEAHPTHSRRKIRQINFLTIKRIEKSFLSPPLFQFLYFLGTKKETKNQRIYHDASSETSSIPRCNIGLNRNVTGNGTFAAKIQRTNEQVFCVLIRKLGKIQHFLTTFRVSYTLFVCLC